MLKNLDKLITLIKYINANKPYNGYLCTFSK